MLYDRVGDIATLDASAKVRWKHVADAEVSKAIQGVKDTANGADATL